MPQCLHVEVSERKISKTVIRLAIKANNLVVAIACRLSPLTGSSILVAHK